jgi:MscS family membrane protein
MPAWLTRDTIGGLLVWQLAALPVLLVVALGLGALAGRAMRAGAAAAARRTANTWDDALLARTSAPVTVALTLLFWALLLPLADLPPAAAAILARLARGVLLLAVFWAAWRAVDVGRHAALQSQWAARVVSSRALVPLGARVAKALLLIIGAIALLSLMGYPVGSLIAGLGIGGLAVALAAQKTVENLFGAFSIGVDQPFREGDFVKVEDFVGTVEAIGLRSTRFRTLDRTVVSIPNGKLAEMRLESFTERDRMRLAAVIGLVYGTTAAQLRDVLAGLEAVLRAHPRIWSDAVVVKFREFGASSLDVEIMAWFQTADWGEFQAIRQEILIAFMDVVERAGTSFAFPTRTIHLAAGASHGSAPHDAVP